VETNISKKKKVNKNGVVKEEIKERNTQEMSLRDFIDENNDNLKNKTEEEEKKNRFSKNIHFER